MAKRPIRYRRPKAGHSGGALDMIASTVKAGHVSQDAETHRATPPSDVSGGIGFFDLFAGASSRIASRAPFFAFCVHWIVVSRRHWEEGTAEPLDA